MDDVQSWWEVPSIAHFCSLFRAAFNLLDFDIEDLEEALLTDGADDTGSCLLQDLIVRLLAGCLGHSPNNTDISPFNYQMFLRRYLRQKCQEQYRDNPFNTDIDFQFLPLRTKVQIIHALCDFRLDADDVQDVLKNLESDSLRVDPLGHDANASAYYYFYGTRLYREDMPQTGNKNRGKVKGRKLKQEKVKKKRGRPSAKEKKSTGQGADEEDNEDSDNEGAEMGVGTWQVICYTEEDWEKLAAGLKGSTVKEEKSLYRVLAEDFLPEIPRLFAEKERLQRKRMQEFLPRRQSSRIEKLAKEKEENARILAKEEEERKVKEAEERERRQRQLEEDILKERAEGRTYQGTTRLSSLSCSSRSESEEDLAGAKPVGRQTNNSLASATGKIHITSSRRKMRGSQVFRATTDDIKTGMFKVLEQLKNHEDAWPFLDEVSEDYAPRYYSVIRKPMDLNRMCDKLDDGSYTSVSHFRADFMRIIDNCRVYNGDGSEYTEMAMNLLARFEKCMERYVGSGFSSDEEVAVEFPPEDRHRKKHRHHRRHRRHSQRSHHSSQSDSSRDPSKHRSKERKKEPDGRKRSYEDDEENEDGNTLPTCRNDSDWDHSRDHGSKSNHRRTHASVRVGDLDKSHRFRNDGRFDSPIESSQENDQDWKDEDFSDHRSRDSSSSGPRLGKKRRDDIRKSTMHKKKRDDIEAKDSDKISDRSSDKRGVIRSERDRDSGTKPKSEPLTWEEQQRRDKAWSELVGAGESTAGEDEKKDIFSVDLDDAGWEGLKQGLKEWKREKNQLKKPEKISDSKRMKRMSQEEEDKWFEEKETLHKDITLLDTDPFTALEREMSSNENFRRKHKERLEAESGGEDKLQSKGVPQLKKGAGVLKNPAIHQALSIATEETLKDLNMWLDDAPRCSEFSSSSSSPSQCLGDDQDSQRSQTSSKQDDKEKDGNGKRKSSGNSSKPNVSGKDGVKDAAAGSSIAKRRTTERLQPGKSKGNLITNIQGETATSKESRAAAEWSKLTAPKLSLGSVLKSGFGVGVGLVNRHNFSDNSAESTPKDGGSSPNDLETDEDKEKAYIAAQKKALLEATLRREREEAEERARREEEEEALERERERERERQRERERRRREEEEEEQELKKLKEEEYEEGNKSKPKQKPNPTPNLSAWFKAFGAPKSQPAAVVRRKPELSATLDISRISGSPAQDSPGDTPSRRDDMEYVPMTPGKRQRKLSTGSSVSEKSSFSQEQNDGSSPSYPAPFPSPLHRSPEAQRPLPPYPSNIESTIRVGFYQDTTYKSPEKSSSGSPRDSQALDGAVAPHQHAHAYVHQSAGFQPPPYPPYSPAPYTPSEMLVKQEKPLQSLQPHSPAPASSPSPAHPDARSPSHLQIDLHSQSPRAAHAADGQGRSPMNADSPVDSRLQIDTRSPMHAGSPLDAESPRLHIDARSPLDGHVRSPLDGHGRSPSEYRTPSSDSRSPLHGPGSSPHEPRLQIDTRSPVHAVDSRSPLHSGSPVDQRLHIDTRSPSRSPAVGSPSPAMASPSSSHHAHLAMGSPKEAHLQSYAQAQHHAYHHHHQQQQQQQQQEPARYAQHAAPQQYHDPYLTSRGGAPAQPGPYRPTPHASPAPVYSHQLHHKHLLQQTLIKQQQEKEQQLLQQQQQEQLMLQKLQEKQQQQQLQEQQRQQQLMLQKLQQEKQQQQQYLQRQQQLQQEQHQQLQQHQQQYLAQQQQQQQQHQQQQLLVQQQQQQQQQLLAQQQQQHLRSRAPVSSFPVKKRHYAESAAYAASTNFPTPSSVVTPTATPASSTSVSSATSSASTSSSSMSAPMPTLATSMPRSPFSPGGSVGVPVGGARSPFTPVNEVTRSPFTPVTAASSASASSLHQHLSLMDVYPRHSSPFYPTSGAPLYNRPGSAFRESQPAAGVTGAPAPSPSVTVYPTKGQMAAAAAAAAAAVSAPSPPAPVVTTPKQEAKMRQKAAKQASEAAQAALEASGGAAASGAAFPHFALKDVAKVLPGSAFNFGPTSGLGLYSDKDSYSAYPTAGYYGHRATAAGDAADVAVPGAAGFPYLGHQSHQAQRAAQAAATAAYPPALAQALMDPAASAAYQQYLLQTGLYPTAGYHAAALGLRPPYDSMQRPPWM